MALGKADLVLHQGQVYGHPASDSLAIGSGRIVAHGKFRELTSLVGPRTHVIRLGGRMVAPGFIDSHLHFLEAASATSGLQVSKARTIADLLAELRAAAARTPPGDWIRAFGCDEALLKERRGPTRAELDKAVTKNPLRIRHQTLHASWLNSLAIVALGLERPDYQPPPGANLVRSETGKLSGLVAGMEQWLTCRLPAPTLSELEARAWAFSRELAAAGVTAFTDATVRNGPEEVKLFARLVRSNAISQRVLLMLGAPNLDQVREASEIAENGGIRLTAAKFMEHNAAVGVMAGRVAAAMNAGLDCAFHATEVEELEAAISAIELVRRQVGVNPFTRRGFRIEHGGLIPPNYLPRLAGLGAWVVTNPGFIYYRGPKYAAEPGLVPYIYRARSLIEAGVRLAAGTDAPVTPARPLAAIAAAVTRLSAEGAELGPAEKLDPPTAIDVFTKSAAELARLDAGQIEAGRLADLIVLPADPAKLAPAQLRTLQPEMTIVGGRLVYERGRPAAAAGV